MAVVFADILKVLQGLGRDADDTLIDAAGELGVDPSASEGTIKRAFRHQIDKRHGGPRRRLGLAYDMMLSHVKGDKSGRYRQVRPGQFVAVKHDLWYMIISDDVEGVINFVKKQPSALRLSDDHQRSLLYIAARNNYFDMAKALLQLGENVNSTQKTKSTPLHAAAYYGHEHMVQALLEYGADPAKTNIWRHKAEEEARSDKIKKIITTFHEDHIGSIILTTKRRGLTDIVTTIYDSSDDSIVVARRVRLSKFSDSKYDSWTRAWHGTKFRHLSSIAEHGLRASGTKLKDGTTLQPEKGHISLGIEKGGFSDWARAVFVSPSIFYAGHVVYAERISALGKRWAVLIECRVKPDSYSKHSHTLLKSAEYDMPGEPTDVEYRVETRIDTDIEDAILRVPDKDHKNIVPIALTFVSVDFLEQASTFEDGQAVTDAVSVRGILV